MKYSEQTMFIKVTLTRGKTWQVRHVEDKPTIMRRGWEKEETKRFRSKFTNNTIHFYHQYNSSNDKRVGIRKKSEQSDQYISPNS